MKHIFFSNKATKQFKKLDPTLREKMARKIDALKTFPMVDSDVKALNGPLRGCYRLRVGEWRVIFKEDEKNVRIDGIFNRRDAYKY